MHCGYGFAIGNVAAFDVADPDAVVSPGGVGFDINCGVRLIRTNLHVRDVRPVQETLTQVAGGQAGTRVPYVCQALFDHIPVGVGVSGQVKVNQKSINDVLNEGLDWATRHGKPGVRVRACGGSRDGTGCQGTRGPRTPWRVRRGAACRTPTTGT